MTMSEHRAFDRWVHRLVFMRPLPIPPAFPVYGLPDSFDGFRWLALWQREPSLREGEISDVMLGHGHPDQGHCLRVTTVLKAHERNVGDHGSIGAIGIEYTAQNAVIGMVEATEPFDPSRSSSSVALLDSEMARVVETGAGSSLSAGSTRQCRSTA
jgi:hypothetical protein